VTRLGTVEGLSREATQLMQIVAAAHPPTTDAEVIQEFANVARLRELCDQLGWDEPTVVELYRLLAVQVQAIIVKEVGAA
jgi:hypothetical protein